MPRLEGHFGTHTKSAHLARLCVFSIQPMYVSLIRPIPHGTLAYMPSSECETDKPSKSSMLALPPASTRIHCFVPTASQGQHMAS